MRSWRDSPDGDFNEIWEMTARIKQHMEVVDEKIKEAGRAAYLPTDVTSTDQLRPSGSDLTALERRLLHYQSRKFGASSRRASDYDSNYPPTPFRSDQLNVDRVSALSINYDTNERRKNSNPPALTIAEQSRLFTVADILDGRSGIANFDLTSSSSVLVTRPRSSMEHRSNKSTHFNVSRSGVVLDFKDEAAPLCQRRHSSTSANATSHGRSLSKSRTASIPTSSVVPKCASIDKQVPVGRLLASSKSGLSGTRNSDLEVRKPRIFSHLKRHSSIGASVEREVEHAGAVEPLVYGNGSRGPSSAGNNNGKQSSSSSTAATTKTGTNSSIKSSSQVDTPIRSKSQDQGSARASSLSSAISLFSSSSPPSKLDREDASKTVNPAGPDQPVSRGESQENSADGNSRKQSPNSNNARASVLAMVNQDSSGEESNRGTSLPTEKTNQRRVVSPPRRRALGEKKKMTLEKDTTTLANGRSRSYDRNEIRLYMEKKRKERKLTTSAQRQHDEMAIDKRRSTQKYGQEEIEEFIQRKKTSENVERKRAMERIQAAKMEQERRLKEILEEQNRRKRVPLTKIIGEVGTWPDGSNKENGAVLKEQSEKKGNPMEKQTGQWPRGDIETRVNSIRAKYRFFNGSSHSPEEVYDEVQQENDGPSHATCAAKGSSNNHPTVNQNGATSKISNASSSSHFPATRHDHAHDPAMAAARIQSASNQIDRDHVDEYNIVNTILRKHPYLRVTTVYMPGSIDRGWSNTVGYQRNSVADSQERTDAASTVPTMQNGLPHSAMPSVAGSGHPDRSHNSRTITGQPDDPVSHMSTADVSSISTLTLSSDHGSTMEIDRPRSLDITSGNREYDQNEQVTSSPIMSPVAASNLRLQASLNYMQALQYSLEQIEAAKEIGSFMLSEQAATSATHLMEANVAAQRWEQQLRETRVNAELQRLKAESDRATAAQELRLASEMTANQRRLMETIMAANQQLLEHSRTNREGAQANVSSPDTVKLAAEVAASAATAATLTALKRASARKKSSGSASTSPSTLSSASNLSSSGQSGERGTSTTVNADAVSPVESVVAGSKVDTASALESMRTIDGGSGTVISTDRATSTVPTEDITSRPTTSRSSQTSTITSDAETQTKELLTAPASSASAMTVTEEESGQSVATASEIAIVESSPVRTATFQSVTSHSSSASTVKNAHKRQGSSELSENNSDDQSASSSVGREHTPKLVSAVRKHRLDLEKFVEDDQFSLSMSDMSDHESRIQALRSNLDERRRIADKLKQEYKRRVKASMENTEKSLLNQLNAYDSFIENAEKQLKELETTGAGQRQRSVTPPRILSPRTSSETDAMSSPGRKSTTPSPRTTRRAKPAASASQRGSSVSTITERSTAEVQSMEAVKTTASEKSDSSTANSAPLPLAPISTLHAPDISTDIWNSSPRAPAIGLIPPARQESTSAETVEEVSEMLDEVASESLSTSRRTPEPESLSQENQTPRTETPVSEKERSVENGEESTPRMQSKEISITNDVESARSEETSSSTRSNSTQKSKQNQEASSTPSEVSSVDHSNEETKSDRSLVSDQTARRVEDEQVKIDGSMKSHGTKTVDLIVNGVLFDTIEHCVTTWKTYLEKVDSGRRIDDEERKNRLAEVIVDAVIGKTLDEVIEWVVFAGKWKWKKEDNAGVISERQLDNIRRMVTGIENEKGYGSAGSSPRSPRTPISDRYNEAFRQPNHPHEMLDGTKSTLSPVADESFAFNDEQWMDDDFGLGDSEDKDSKKIGSPRSARFDLSKFTTEIFSTVPSSKSAIDPIVDDCVRTLHDQRNSREPLELSKKPSSLYSIGKEDSDGSELELSLNRESDRMYRDFLFDMCREIVDDVFSEDRTPMDGRSAKWKKLPRLRFSMYSKLRPGNTNELQLVVRDAVTSHLDLDYPGKKGKRSARQKLICRRTLDRVDEIVLGEIYEEEHKWTVYDEEEMRVKLQLADSILDTVLDETLEKMVRK